MLSHHILCPKGEVACTTLNVYARDFWVTKFGTTGVQRRMLSLVMLLDRTDAQRAANAQTACTVQALAAVYALLPFATGVTV